MRLAYRALARRLHPDRLGDASRAERALAERRMREINEAWRVLGDAARRRDYDRSRLRTSTADRRAARPGPVARPVGLATQDDDDLVDVLPPMTALTAGVMRHLPWVAILVVLGGIFIATAYASTANKDPATTSHRPVAVGRCIDLAAGPSVHQVPCGGPHDFQVVDRVADSSECQAPATARRFETDGSWDCLVASSGS